LVLRDFTEMIIALAARFSPTNFFFIRSTRMSKKHGSLSAQELKCLQGGELILNGYDNEEISDIVGVSTSVVQKWRRKRGGKPFFCYTFPRQ